MKVISKAQLIENDQIKYLLTERFILENVLILMESTIILTLILVSKSVYIEIKICISIEG